jgi:hypothetical protein
VTVERLFDRKLESPPGGVMTREVGAITGSLLLRGSTERARDGACLLRVRVTYDGALEWYEV